MNDEKFEGCCGARILWGFPYLEGYSKSYKETHTKRVRNRLKEKFYQHRQKAFLMLILNENQVEHWGPVVKELGFSFVEENDNPHDEGHMCYFFIATPDRDMEEPELEDEEPPSKRGRFTSRERRRSEAIVDAPEERGEGPPEAGPQQGGGYRRPFQASLSNSHAGMPPSAGNRSSDTSRSGRRGRQGFVSG